MSASAVVVDFCAVVEPFMFLCVYVLFLNWKVCILVYTYVRVAPSACVRIVSKCMHVFVFLSLILVLLS